MSGRYALAIDVGGTFTDVVIADRQGGLYLTAKTGSTPADPAEGFFTGVAQALELAEAGPADIGVVLHGSTVATNAILEGKGAKTALITTKGFRHVLEIGRGEIPRGANLYGWVKPPRPIRPRDIFEIPERIRRTGEVATPLDETAVEALCAGLREDGYVSAAILFLHSYANPAHERRTAEILRGASPELEISLSSEVLPVFREYERAMATAINARLQPLVGRYVGTLDQGLKSRGIAAPLYIMKSNGGVFPPAVAARSGAHLALSGPAAGAQGAAFLGRLAGISNMVTIDMGGTSADVALIRDGAPETSTSTRINEQPLALPVIDIHTIGAGGGSIASVAPHGAILVGPESAGADPGPAAYGKGGQRATVTDANLTLGRIPPHLLDGAVPLDAASAQTALMRDVGDVLGTDAASAARGVIAIVDQAMTGALKLMSVERGLDPGQFTLAAFGGAGPAHGAALMRSLGARDLFLPRHPGLLCAAGLLATDLRYDFALTRLQRAGAVDGQELDAAFQALTAQAVARLAEDGVAPDRQRLSRHADLRYAGQGMELTVPFPDGPAGPGAADATAAFHALHQRLFTFSDPDGPVEIVNLRVAAAGLSSHIAPPEIGTASGTRPAPSGSRQVICGEGPAESVPVYRREALRADQEIEGPAVFDQLDSTSLILPGQTARVDRFGNLIVREASP